LKEKHPKEAILKPIESISNFLRNIQKKLFPNLQEVLGPLTEKQQKLVKILEMIRIEEYIPIYRGFRGRPENDRQSLARAFVAKAVYNIPRTNQLREQLLADNSLRQICGWDSKFDIPSESTFSRAFAEFSSIKLPQKVHQFLIKSLLSDELIGHISRDSTAIEVRERPSKAKLRLVKKKKSKKKKGRPKKGEIREKELSRLEKQSLMTLDEMLKDLPVICDVGNKRDSKGYKTSWTGYKLHIDTADGDIPISCILTSASIHDSQVALPLAEMTKQRVTNFYDLMDAAYDSPIIKEHSRKLNHIPIIDINPRRNKELKLKLNAEDKIERLLNIKNPEKTRYNQRSSVERVNARLKDEFGGRNVRVKGHLKVMTHLMFGILVLTADQLMKLVL
jgi:hypothetical protein